MRSFIALSLCLALVVACNPNRIKKEYSTADIEYNSKSNFWTQKSDGSIIKVNFAITDEIVDGIPCRREVMVDKYGVVETSDLYNYTTHIEHCDYSQAPNQIRITLYPTHPDNKTGTKVYHQKVRGSEGYTVFVKDMYEETVAEMIYDEQGNLVKTYDWENGARVILMAEQLFPENIKAGVEERNGSFLLTPTIEFSLRNKSGKTIDETLYYIYYKFTVDDEIIDDSHKLLSASGGWENNMSMKVRIQSIHSLYGYQLEKSKIRVTIRFRDNSIIYDGPVPYKIINSIF